MSSYHSVSKRITELLTSAGIVFSTYEHEAVRTSQEAARVRPGFSLAQGAKALIVRAKKDGVKKFIMIIVPGDRKFDAKKLHAALGYGDVRFATSEEVSTITGGIVPGGVPPFGNLFALEVVADEGIFENEMIIFNAGDRRFSIAIRSLDYRNIVHPSVARIAHEP